MFGCINIGHTCTHVCKTFVLHEHVGEFICAHHTLYDMHPPMTGDPLQIYLYSSEELSLFSFTKTNVVAMSSHCMLEGREMDGDCSSLLNIL